MNVNGMLMIMAKGHAHEGECDGLAQEACEADEDCDWHDNHQIAVVVAWGTLNQELCALQQEQEWHADDNARETVYSFIRLQLVQHLMNANGMLMITHVKVTLMKVNAMV